MRARFGDGKKPYPLPRNPQLAGPAISGDADSLAMPELPDFQPLDVPDLADKSLHADEPSAVGGGLQDWMAQTLPQSA